MLLWYLIAASCLQFVAARAEEDSFIIEIAAKPTNEDEYCVSRHAAPKFTRGRRVIGFEPQPGWAAHHMTLYTCQHGQGIPTSTAVLDACANQANVCGSIQFVWAHGGTSLFLPPNVGLYIGPETSFALQVHYGYPTSGWTDRSGVKLFLADEEITTSKQEWYEPKVWLLAPSHFPLLRSNQTNTAVVGEDTVRQDLVVFAVRMHAHIRGKYNEVSIYRKRTPVWQYSRSTQLAQSFVPLPQHVELSTKDVVKFKCVYDTTKQSTHTHQGATKHDEMCNIYLMFYVKPKCPSSTTAVVLELMSRHFATKQIVGVSAVGNVGVAFHRANRIWDDKSFDQHTDKFLLPAIKQDVIVMFDLDSPHIMKQVAGANMFYMPHSVRIDPYHHANTTVWLVDVGSHTVSEFNLESKTVVRFAGKHMDPSVLCKPTDVAFSATEIFVSDGYCHSRIVVYDRDDLSIVKRELAVNEFDIPHAIVYHSTSNFLFVADREHGRIVAINALTGNREFEVSSWSQPGYLPYSLAVLPGNRLIVGLVKRFGFRDAERAGLLWQSEPDNWQRGKLVDCLTGDLKEPHMLSAGRGKNELFVAEAVDGRLEGKLLRVNIVGI